MKNMVEMSEDPTGIVSWRHILLKIIIILILPLSIFLDTGGVWLESGFTIGMWMSILFIMTPFSSITFASPISILIAIFLMIPGIYFDRKINSGSISSPMRKKAIISAVATWLLSFGFMFLIVYDPYFDSSLAAAIYSIPTLAIPIFIFWPLLNREFLIRSTPLKMQEHSFSHMSNVFGQQFRKQRALSLLLWVGALLSPILLIGFWGDVFLLTVLYNITLHSGGLFGYGILQFFASTISLIPNVYLPAMMLIFSLRFIFVRDIYRFIDRKVSKSRLISTGLLAEIVPVTVLTLLGTPFPGFYSQVILPTPIFPLIGYFFARLSKVHPLREELWDEEEHRMWFEGDKPAPPPHKQPMEQGIKVPLTYMIVSQFRRLRKH